MNKLLREHADAIIASSINAVKPDEAVSRALAGQEFTGRVVLVAAGKAAWQMAKAAHDCLGDRIDAGVVVTKYDHVMGPSPTLTAVKQVIRYRMKIPSQARRLRLIWLKTSAQRIPFFSCFPAAQRPL